MFGFSKQPVDQYAATGEIERVYFEIQQTLRVSGVNLIFRNWASHDNLLPILWDRLKPNCELEIFEQFADSLRSMAASSAIGLPKLNARDVAGLGESQSFQLHEALKLYHFVNPKLLLFSSAVALALEDDLPRLGADDRIVAKEGRHLGGVPPDMYPMEMVAEEPSDSIVKETFDDIKQTLTLESINSDYRTMALWPNYLTGMWRSLKPITQQSEYVGAADRLRDLSRQFAKQLPRPIEISVESIKRAKADPDAAIDTTRTFERLLPGLIVNIAICLRDFEDDDRLKESPWPLERRSIHVQSESTKGNTA